MGGIPQIPMKTTYHQSGSMALIYPCWGRFFNNANVKVILGALFGFNITHRIHGTGMYLSPVTLISMVNAGKHTIRGSYGYAKYHTHKWDVLPQKLTDPLKNGWLL